MVLSVSVISDVLSVNIGGKVVKELCNPVYKTWIETKELPYNCTECHNELIYTNILKTDCYNQTMTVLGWNITDTKGFTYIEKNDTYTKNIKVCYNYTESVPSQKEVCKRTTCYDTLIINHNNEQVDCIPTGKIEGVKDIPNTFAKIIGNKVCYYDLKDGGRYAVTWLKNDEVNFYCKDLLTDVETIKGEKSFKDMVLNERI